MLIIYYFWLLLIILDTIKIKKECLEEESNQCHRN
jgi:hypothetical protein